MRVDTHIDKSYLVVFANSAGVWSRAIASPVLPAAPLLRAFQFVDASDCLPVLQWRSMEVAVLHHRWNARLVLQDGHVDGRIAIDQQ